MGAFPFFFGDRRRFHKNTMVATAALEKRTAAIIELVKKESFSNSVLAAFPLLARIPDDDATPNVDDKIIGSLVPSPTTKRLVALIRAALFALPIDNKAAVTAELTRTARAFGGVPVRSVPLASAPAFAAAMRAVANSEAAVVFTTMPLEAAATADAVERTGSAE